MAILGRLLGCRGSDIRCVLASAFSLLRLSQILLGFAASFGVYQDFYSRHEQFSGSGYIATIGTTTSVRSVLEDRLTST
jgi:hypothetical protein